MRRTYTPGSPIHRIDPMRPGIEQSGVVRANTKGKIRIAMDGQGACAGCHSLCLLGTDSGEIELTAGEPSLAPGARVMIRFNRSSGYTAILFLYLVPFVVMLTTLVALLNTGWPERYAGSASLLVLIPYFLLVYALRKKFATHCNIQVDRL